MMRYFVKSRRAQTKDDFETWNEGGVSPTLNSFDMGDKRATVIVFASHMVDGARVQDKGVLNTMSAHMGTGGGNVPMVVDFRNGSVDEGVTSTLQAKSSGGYSLNYLPGVIAIQGNVIGRSETAGPQGKGHTEEGEPMFTLTKTDIHAIATPSIVRRLTPTECERLQGFPAGWTDGQADSHRYKQMGNAVAVPVVEWIVARLVGIDNDSAKS